MKDLIVIFLYTLFVSRLFEVEGNSKCKVAIEKMEKDSANFHRITFKKVCSNEKNHKIEAMIPVIEKHMNKESCKSMLTKMVEFTFNDPKMKPCYDEPWRIEMANTAKLEAEKICGECTVDLAKANKDRDACSSKDGQTFSEQVQGCIVNRFVEAVDPEKFQKYQEVACERCPKLMENMMAHLYRQLIEKTRADCAIGEAKMEADADGHLQNTPEMASITAPLLIDICKVLIAK